MECTWAGYKIREMRMTRYHHCSSGTSSAKYNAPTLVWNDTLATYAETYINKCIWEHSNLNPYGENLPTGYGKSYNIAKGIQDWANENRYNSSAEQANSYL
ncbi:hypothetical protein D9758_018428 [Tetrapyrgos nigripes]|uniref:SCP domain-containing protein n=1 Tax=Tetrapyrgos nigripes TaxID=182062 RepID=A0A8H5C4X4_9AGAR|nr:hypothetical protein D9758_018428 [Tetrapyrgos nigripes]